MDRENIEASIESLRALSLDIEGVEVDIEIQQKDMAEAQATLQEQQKEVRDLRETLNQRLTKFQDGLFQEMAHPANYLERELAIEYVDCILRGVDQDIVDETIPAASALSRIVLPSEDVQPAYFSGMQGINKGDLVTLFQGNGVDYPLLTVENHNPGILTFMAEVQDPSTVFVRRPNAYPGWRVDCGTIPTEDWKARIDMAAEDLTITDDPERVIKISEQDNPAKKRPIVAIGVEAVSAAIDYSRSDASQANADNLMKHILAKILGQPIPGKSLDVGSLRDNYYNAITNSVGNTYDFKNATNLPLILHGSIFEDIFAAEFSFDQERFQEAVADGLGNVSYGGRSGIRKTVESTFWNICRRKSINEACEAIGEMILGSIQLNDIVNARGQGGSTRLINVLKADVPDISIKLEVVKEALEQSGADYDWTDYLSRKTRRLKRYKKALDKQVDTN